MMASFRQMLLEATRRTRAGDLHGATALIRAALRGDAAPSAPTHGRAPDAVPGAVSAGDDAGEQPRAGGRFIAGRFGAGALARDFKLFVPPAAWTGPLPLVVMLHGCKQDPDDFAIGTGMNEEAAAQGVFVLYPAQARNANVAKCWNWFKRSDQVRGGGEAGLIAAMTQDIMARYPVDPRRVYVAGLSAGGAMAAILGDAYPDLFAAIGVHSGLPAGAASDTPSAFAAMKHGAPVARQSGGSGGGSAGAPAIVFHGDRDATVNPVNGEQVVALRVGATTPAIEHGRTDRGREWTRRIYRAPDGERVIAEHWIVHGAGHAWSGGHAGVHAGGSFVDGTGPAASREMLRFFLSHTLESPAR